MNEKKVNIKLLKPNYSKDNMPNGRMSIPNIAKPLIGGSLPLTAADIKFRCTRFAHACRLKGIVTNNDTVNLYEQMFGQ